jgi:hypothetical protein
MHRALYLAAIVLWLAAYPVASFAEKDTSSANYIAEGCRRVARNNAEGMDSDTTRQFWMCGGALKATEQLMQIHHEYCPPSDYGTVQDDAFVVAKYMDNHPERLHEGMALVIFRALQEEWPCKRTDK